MSTKTRLGAHSFLYPMPTVIVGTVVNDKPNFMTISYCGILDHKPPMISVASVRTHYSNVGIRLNQTFSINIPGAELVEATDAAGLASGQATDKSELFTVTDGTLPNTPLIAECKLNLECKLVDILHFDGTTEVFVGEIVETHAAEEILTNGLPDMGKLQPILFSYYNNQYWKIGDPLATAWMAGKKHFAEKAGPRRPKED